MTNQSHRIDELIKWGDGMFTDQELSALVAEEIDILRL